MKKIGLFVLSCSLGAGAALATEFPTPVDGVITLAGSGTVTYDSALPAATKLVKTGSGTAILTVDTTSFSGAVDVQEGTLQMNTLKAVGTGSQISVTGTAATLHLFKPTRPAGCGQNTVFFGGHNLTISGAGVDGKGAFRYTGDGNGVDDSMLDSLSLSGDASFAFHTRCGVKGPINLNGHTLTHVGETTYWMFFATTQIDAGKIVLASGRIFAQTTPEFTDPENTMIELRGGTLTPRYLSKPFDCPLLLVNGGFSPDGGGGEGYNVFSRPVTVAPTSANGFTLACQTDRSLNFTDSLVLQGVLKIGGGTGQILVQGPITGNYEIQCVGYQTLVLTSKVDRAITMLRINDCGPIVHVGDGTLNVGQLRMGNSIAGRGMIYQTGGTISNFSSDSARIGEATGSHGVLWIKDGTCDFKKEMHVAYSAGSDGMILQEGGTFQNANSKPIELGEGGRGYLIVAGGVNDSVQGLTTDQNGIKMSSAGGESVLTVSWSGVVRTSTLQMGNTTTATTNIVNVMNGGTLEACRFFANQGRPAGSLAVVNVDGGVLKPTFGWGWDGIGSADTSRNADHFVIYSGGLVVDTSDSRNKPSGYARCQFSNQLEAPQGKRIKSISLPADTNFASQLYYGPMPIMIEGPAGSYGASAYATFGYGTAKLTGVTVLSGGCNYDQTTRICVPSADGKSRYACTYELEDNPRGGGLTKRGAQELRIFGRATYDGATVVEEGVLAAQNSACLPQNRPLVVKEGATLSLASELRVSTLELSGEVIGQSLVVTNAIEVSVRELYTGTGARSIAKSLTLGDNVKLVVKDPENLSAYGDCGSKVLLTAEGGISGDIQQIETSSGALSGWRVRKISNKSWTFGPKRGLVVVVR